MQIEPLRVARYDELVASIYRSVDCDTPWSEPLDLLRDMMDANVACLRLSHKGNRPHQHLFAAGPMATPEAVEEWKACNPGELLPIDLPVGSIQVVDWQSIWNSGVFGSMLDRYDVGTMVVMCVDNTEGVQSTLNCSRGAGLPMFDSDEHALLKAVGRHFKEAMRIRREITRSKIVSQFQTEALDSLGIAAFLISESGGHFLLNKTAEFAIQNEIGLKRTSMGLQAVDSNENTGFQSAVRAILRSNDPVRARAMMLTRGDDGERMHVIVRPRSHRSFMYDTSETSALVFMRVNEIVRRDDIRMLQQLFSFTFTEAQLAIGLAKGLCLKDIEAELNIRHNTARAHLRSMFVKADVSRQSQLVSLLTSSLVPLGRDDRPSLQ